MSHSCTQTNRGMWWMNFSSKTFFRMFVCIFLPNYKSTHTTWFTPCIRSYQQTSTDKPQIMRVGQKLLPPPLKFLAVHECTIFFFLLLLTKHTKFGNSINKVFFCVGKTLDILVYQYQFWRCYHLQQGYPEGGSRTFWTTLVITTDNL